jgi:hypothetical protein
MPERADHSIVKDSRLVAHVFAGGQGELARAGRKGREPLAALPWGRIELFEASAAALFVDLAAKSESLEAFLWKVGMEGYDVRPGEVTPNLATRRF